MVVRNKADGMTAKWLSYQPIPEDQERLDEATILLNMWRDWVFSNPVASEYGTFHYWRSIANSKSVISDRLGLRIDAAILSLGSANVGVIKAAFLGGQYPNSPEMFDSILLEFLHAFNRTPE